MAGTGKVIALIKALSAAGASPEEIKAAVAEWLAEHVDPDTGYVIDDTFSIPGAAPDAKLTGDELNDLKSAINNSLFDKGYELQTPVSTVSGCRTSLTQDNRIYMTSDSGQILKAYPVKSGEKYLIRSYGYDVDSFIVAAVGTTLVGKQEATAKLQVIECGGSTYPKDYTNHILFITIENDGYLYINERTSSAVTSFACKYMENKSVFPYAPTGVIVNDGEYTHFALAGDGIYTVRQFKRRGPNNLFQLANAGRGYIIDGIGYVELESFTGAINTDIVGPASIAQAGSGQNGLWAGGNHSRTVEGVECPTAEQLSLTVTVGNQTITENGIYYGAVKIVAVNKIYFPQTITGNTFDGATAAMNETRTYILSDTMRVNVTLEMLENTTFVVYYGMQYVTPNVDKIIVPADETVVTLPLSASYAVANKSHDLIMLYKSGVQLHMILDQIGLGTFAENSGETSYGYGMIPSAYNKVYHTLIAQKSITAGKMVYWSGEYRYDF